MPAQAIDRGLFADLIDMIWSVSARVYWEIQARLQSGVRKEKISIMKIVLARRQPWHSHCRIWSHTGTRGCLVRRAELVPRTEVPLAAFSVSIITLKGDEMYTISSRQDCVVDSGLSAPDG